jgi:tRNA-splicing endonuclease subunit Sen34
VQTTPQTLISAHELIAAGRLGTAVKKAHVLCSVKGAKEESDDAAWQRILNGEHDAIEQTWGDVDFISLTWAGFGI